MSLTLEMPTGKTPKRKSKFLIGFFLLLFILIIILFAWIYGGRIVSENGQLSAEFLPIPSPMTSTLSEVLVEPNAYVKKGQLLAKLESSDYTQQITAAQALVQRTIDTNKLTTDRVLAAQKAAEDLVERIALARHEENSRKALVEQRSVEHAKALLRMRDAEANGESEAKKSAAIKAESFAKQNLANAKISFEHASQSRSAIEGELHKIRNNNMATGQNPMPINFEDPSLIKSPMNGYLTTKIPLAGKKVNMGETVFQILPESNAKLSVVASLTNKDAQKIKINSLCYVLPDNSWRILSGRVINVAMNENANIKIELDTNSSIADFDENNSARAVFWAHPLTDNIWLNFLFMLFSYLPI